jgi:hypothetical protein
VTTTKRMHSSTIVQVLAVGTLAVFATACASSVTVPSDVGTVDQLVSSLRAQGLSVSLGDEASPQRNGYFSVSSRDVTVGDVRLKAFEYETATKADADAALITADGQPNPRAQVGWISAPTFYKQGQLIVLYVGCSADMMQTLNGLLGPASARGPGCK